MLYVIWYSKKHSRITGSYLVNTTSLKEARLIFSNQIDRDQERKVEQVQPFSVVLDEYEETQDEFLGDIIIPNEGEYVLIEAGT